MAIQFRAVGVSYLYYLFLYIDEPSRLHAFPLEAVLHHGERPPYLPTPFDAEVAPLAQRGRGWYVCVIALNRGGRLVALDPATRLARLVGLYEEGVPVGNRPDEPAHVDVVERFRCERPLAGAILDLARTG